MRRRRGRARHGVSDRHDTPGDGETSAQIRDDIQWLYKSVLPYSIELDRVVQDRLFRFATELIRWNDRLNLLARTDVVNVVRKHVAASLGVFLVAPPTTSERWIDVGTGGGFPGFVLRMVHPEMDITLMDSARKRCLFLESVARELDLGPVPVLAMRAETHLAHGEGRRAYDAVTTRAVAALRETLTLFGPLVRERGRIITYKGPRWAEELEAAEAAGALGQSGFEFISATRIPWTSGHILVLQRRDGD